MDINALVQKVTGGAQGNHGTLSTVMGMIGGQNQTGFNNLLSSLTTGGLGDQVKSWIGTGANRVVSGQQVASWLGNDKLNQVAHSVGLSPNEVADHLAQQLPAFVDKLTPMAPCQTRRAWKMPPGRLSASSRQRHHGPPKLDGGARST